MKNTIAFVTALLFCVPAYADNINIHHKKSPSRSQLAKMALHSFATLGFSAKLIKTYFPNDHSMTEMTSMNGDQEEDTRILPTPRTNFTKASIAVNLAVLASGIIAFKDVYYQK